MIKRISILVRRPQDDRAAFTAHWSGTHGHLVARLPDIARYTQNHVLEEFPLHLESIGQYDIDGFVELYFAGETAMRTAFAGERAAPIWEDEPNFLAHSTAYLIAGDREPHPALTNAKLIVVAAGGSSGVRWLAGLLGKLPSLSSLAQEDVAEVIPRATMVRGPQPAGVFFHLRFPSVEAARYAAGQLATQNLLDAHSQGINQLAVTRVEEHKVI